jgi:signal-transduction protein with cAMP-binding, CBS, and nucleotidyltransferase domain
VGSVVVRRGDDILGIFTERDLLRRVVAAGKDPSTVVLREVMSSPIKTCRLADDLLACASIMKRTNIRHLAVVEDGRLVGLIGLRDVLAVQTAPIGHPAPVA